MIRTLLFIILIGNVVVSCSLFETRTPEEPLENQTKYPPPVSPQILVENFIRSLNEKNINEYSKLFSNDSSNRYKFYPSAEAISIFPDVFEFWDIKNETIFAQGLFNKFLGKDAPILTLSNSEFNYVLPDSVVFLSDYELIINSSDNSVNNIYKGSLKFCLINYPSATWQIVLWFDYKTLFDGFPSWSILKAKLKS